MHRENTDFLKDMNIQTDVVVANQADSFACLDSMDESGNRVRFITTPFRGVGRNRNTALDYSENEILLFADDDMKYYDGYGDMVAKAFSDNPKADIIVFNIDETGSSEIVRSKHETSHKVGVLNFARYGTVRIAARRSAVARSRLCFTELFGGGCKFGSGEDSLFLRDALRKGLKIYTCPQTIAVVDNSSSSWFCGYTFKFLYDKGSVIKYLFPVLGFVFKYYFAYKFSRKSDIPFSRCVSLMRKGMKYGKKGISYDEYLEGTR